MANGKLIKLLFLILTLSLSSCSYDYDGYPIGRQAYVISVSSDGNYAITSNAGKKIILWDIKNKTSKLISTNANIYSAYFIKNTNMFMWQDLNNIVHIQNIYGKEILSFHNFPTYGHVMTSDLTHYFASNDNLDLYGGYGKNQHLILSNGNQGGFIGLEKLMNLTLSNNNKFLLTSTDGTDYSSLKFNNDDGVALWNVNTQQPIRKFSGNVAKTIATITPDCKYIVGGDEDGRVYVWNSSNGKTILELRDLAYGKIICKKTANGSEQCKMDFTGYPTMPKYLLNKYGRMNGEFDRVYNLKFIDSNYYLHFTTNSPYVVLYQTTNSKPLKYLPLGQYPWPISRLPDYSRDQALDTAPAANILVMAQADGPGIIVYKFDPKTLMLNKIWAPGADFHHFIKVGLLGFLTSLFFFLLFNLKKYPVAHKVTTAIILVMLLLSLFPLYAYGCSAVLVGVLISLVTSYFLKFPDVPVQKLKLIKHS